MAAEENKVIVRRLWEEVWNQNVLAVCDEIFDGEYARHERSFVPILRTAFPDLHFDIEDMIAEGDKVVTRYTFSGTHQGEFMDIPATGKPVKIKCIWIHRLANNRIVEGKEWGVIDTFGMMRQLGVVNNPGGAEA
jgi:predicted ester cyclase